MIRYIIRNKKTGEYLYRTSTSCGKRNKWVAGADNATLLTTKSAASIVAGNLSVSLGSTKNTYSYGYPDCPVEVIKVNVILIPVGSQPFFN